MAAPLALRRRGNGRSRWPGASRRSLELREEGFVGNVQAYSEALIARGDGLTAMPGAAVPEGYGFVFTRTVDGLPVTATCEEALPNPHGEQRPPFSLRKAAGSGA